MIVKWITCNLNGNFFPSFKNMCVQKTLGEIKIFNGFVLLVVAQSLAVTHFNVGNATLNASRYYGLVRHQCFPP